MKEKNDQLILAERYVNETRQNIFLTGKAGTGKTTFVNNLRNTTFKRHVVLAPTGVAAINAQGMTIHSFFQLPFGTLNAPEKQKELKARKYNKKKRAIIRSIDLLIIDEISMVRADVMDAIDDILRKLRRNVLPFGGVQLLLIGDLFQLPPVVRSDEVHTLSQDYNTHYFFGSKALLESSLITIELKHIYRQQAGQFVDILNEVRNNRISEKSLALLNAQYDKTFDLEYDPIILTSHRRTSLKINEERLQALDQPSAIHKAEVEGNFPPSMYPNDEDLRLKVGARVMFIKNDLSEDKLYYNGKLGTLITVEDDLDYAEVRADSGEMITVHYETWENTATTIDPETKELTKEVVGAFSQLPLCLAWAITIHKSQGLTFDHVEIDAKAAFAHGQVYVALSRCRTLEGIKLRSKISSSAIRNDRQVVSYEKSYHDNQPTQSTFLKARKEFERYLLLDIFNYRKLRYTLDDTQDLIKKLLKDHQLSSTIKLDRLASIFHKEVDPVAQKFSNLIQHSFQELEAVRDSEYLLERLQSAAKYFLPIFKDQLWIGFAKLEIELDNATAMERITQYLEDIQWEVFLSKQLYDSLTKGYKMESLIEIRAKSPLHFDDHLAKAKKTVIYKNNKIVNNDNFENSQLYHSLKAWRAQTAADQGTQASSILSIKSIVSICDVLPVDRASLSRIRGVGKKTMDRYADEILKLISDYQAKK